jgi:hypothetical protein
LPLSRDGSLVGVVDRTPAAEAIAAGDVIVEVALITGGPKRDPHVTVPPVGNDASVFTEHDRTTVTRTASALDRLSAAIGLINATNVSAATHSAHVRPEGPSPK